MQLRISKIVKKDLEMLGMSHEEATSADMREEIKKVQSTTKMEKKLMEYFGRKYEN